MATKRKRSGSRVVAIDPHIRRVGYTLFQGSDLTDCGIANLRHDTAAARVRQALIPLMVDMLDEYKPEILLLPDVAADSRRSRFAVDAVGVVTAAAIDRGIAVHTFKNHEVRMAFADGKGRPAKNKHVINQAIVERYPELTISFPQRRRIWDSEHYFTPLFNAVALYWTWRETGGT